MAGENVQRISRLARRFEGRRRSWRRFGRQRLRRRMTPRKTVVDSSLEVRGRAWRQACGDDDPRIVDPPARATHAPRRRRFSHTRACGNQLAGRPARSGAPEYTVAADSHIIPRVTLRHTLQAFLGSLRCKRLRSCHGETLHRVQIKFAVLVLDGRNVARLLGDHEGIEGRR